MHKLIDNLLDRIAEKAAEKIADYVIRKEYQQTPPMPDMPPSVPMDPSYPSDIAVMYGALHTRFRPYVSTVTQANSVDEQYTIEKGE